MGATQKLAIRDAGGKVVAIDVTRRFAPEAWAAADHAETLLNAINPLGFVPFGDKGEPFDPPEEPWPSDKDAVWVGPPNCMEGGEYRAALQFESAAGDLNPDACRSGVCTTE